jgi:hypothetical protein
MRRHALLATLLLAGCVSAPPQTPRPEYRAIAFAMNSWGRPIDSWDITADGRVRYVEAKSDAGAPFGTYRLEHREFAVGPAGFARIAAIAASLPQPRPTGTGCKQRATDFPYGTLRLDGAEASETLTYDTGCRDGPYLDLFIAPLREMDAQVTEWAAKHPVARVEQVGEP